MSLWCTCHSLYLLFFLRFARQWRCLFSFSHAVLRSKQDMGDFGSSFDAIRIKTRSCRDHCSIPLHTSLLITLTGGSRGTASGNQDLACFIKCSTFLLTLCPRNLTFLSLSPFVNEDFPMFPSTDRVFTVIFNKVAFVS